MSEPAPFLPLEKRKLRMDEQVELTMVVLCFESPTQARLIGNLLNHEHNLAVALYGVSDEDPMRQELLLRWDPSDG